MILKKCSQNYQKLNGINYNVDKKANQKSNQNYNNNNNKKNK